MSTHFTAIELMHICCDVALISCMWIASIIYAAMSQAGFGPKAMRPSATSNGNNWIASIVKIYAPPPCVLPTDRPIVPLIPSNSLSDFDRRARRSDGASLTRVLWTHVVLA